jgi:hypothetical protein
VPPRCQEICTGTICTACSIHVKQQELIYILHDTRILNKKNTVFRTSISSHYIQRLEPIISPPKYLTFPPNPSNMERNPLTQPARRCSLPKGTSSLGSTQSSPLPSSCWARASSSTRCTSRRPSRSSACASTSGRRGSVSYSRGTGPCGCDVSESAAATVQAGEAEVAAVLG